MLTHLFQDHCLLSARYSQHHKDISRPWDCNGSGIFKALKLNLVFSRLSSQPSTTSGHLNAPWMHQNLQWGWKNIASVRSHGERKLEKWETAFKSEGPWQNFFFDWQQIQSIMQTTWVLHTAELSRKEEPWVEGVREGREREQAREREKLECYELHVCVCVCLCVCPQR